MIFKITTEQQRAQLIDAISKKKLPFTMEIKKPCRSLEQNKLQRLWLKEAEAQGDCTAEEYRGYCKLHFGAKILYHENEQFKEAYDRAIRGMAYEKQLQLMQLPLDLPVTRIMNTDQKSRYLNAIYEHFTGMGFYLTNP